MDHYLLMVESVCRDPARVEEFLQWYDTVHFPDIMETPGFLSATRYELHQGTEGKGKYVAIYEIETEEIDRHLEAHGRNMKRKEAMGRITDLITVVSRAIYKKSVSLKSAISNPQSAIAPGDNINERR